MITWYTQPQFSDRPLRQFTSPIFALILFALNNVNGQISITVSMDRDRYIRFEPVEVTVLLQNYSGHILHFENEKQNGGGFIQFEITNTKGRTAPPINQDFNPTGGLVLVPGAGRSITLLISDYFNLQEDDDYQLVVRGGHHKFVDDFVSLPKHFQVRSGAQIWKRVVGLPNQDQNKTIVTRMCSLNTIRSGDGDIYFLRIEDSNYVYATIRLGPRVLGINPQCEIDALSRIHTLIQTAPRLLNYRIFDLDGDMKQSSHYMVEKTVPRLFRAPDLGTVTVVGGVSAAEGVDFNLDDANEPASEDMPASMSQIQ